MNPKTVFFTNLKFCLLLFYPAQKQIQVSDKSRQQPKILDSCSSSQIHLWSKSQISNRSTLAWLHARASRTSGPEVSNRLTPTFLLSHRDLMVPRASKLSEPQTQIVGQRPQHFITQKLPATSTKLKINMQSKTACCLQKYNFRHILACN